MSAPNNEPLYLLSLKVKKFIFVGLEINFNFKQSEWNDIILKTL